MAVTLLLIIFLLALLCAIFARHFYKQSRLPPGPRSWSPWGHWYDMNSPDFSKRTSAQYGPLYTLRAGRTLLVAIASAEGAEVFYKHQRTSGRDYSFFPDPFNQILGMCMGALTGDAFKNERTTFQPMFKPRREDLTTLFLKHFDYFVERLGPEQQQVSALRSIIEDVPYRTMCELLYGIINDWSALNTLKEEYKEVWSRVFLDKRMWIPFYSSLFPQSSANQFMTHWTQFNKNAPADSFVGRLNITEPSLHTINEILFANLDVLGSSLTNLIVCLAENPEAQAQCRKEIVPLLASGSTEDCFRLMKYCEAFIKESFRLRPLIAYGLPEVASEDLVIGGYTIPKGTQMMVDFSSLNHNPQYWEDPLQCKPERWKTELPGRRFAFAVKGMGSRQCPGFQGVGMVMMKLALMRLLPLYQITVLEDEAVTVPGKLFTQERNLLFCRISPTCA